MSQELVSVIMPTYNAGRYLSDSIDSILSQTYQNLELLITDDGSSDSQTKQTLKNYSEKDRRVKVFFLQGNNGPGVARNNSIRQAKGRYIAFCDSDDRWFPEKLERQLMLMKEKQCAVCNTSYLMCDEKDEIIGINYAEPETTFKMQKHDNKIGCSTFIYDVEQLGQKFYMPHQRKRQDWALTLSILMKCKKCYAITEPMVYYRQRNNSVSSNKFSLIKYNVKVYETVLGYPKFKAYLYFLFVFLPTYYVKVMKRKSDSRKYLADHK